MARVKDREKAIALRLQEKSYSQIKTELGLSKSTLSGWLANYPLSSEKIKELRDKNPRRIENFRNTMSRKREERLARVLARVKNDLGKLIKRERFLAGFLLYWAEGTKASRYTVAMANTDPSMLKFFIEWLGVLGVARSKLKIKLHLYRDMDVNAETSFWMKNLNVARTAFRKPYIKTNSSERITYKGRFGHGTCNVIFENRDIGEYVHMGVRALRDIL